MISESTGTLVFFRYLAGRLGAIAVCLLFVEAIPKRPCDNPHDQREKREGWHGDIGKYHHADPEDYRVVPACIHFNHPAKPLGFFLT
jgi:hypothetical protein